MTTHHEVVEAFRAGDLPLSNTLESMLDEHVEHRSTRRGCGFTQATRHLAARINRPRAATRFGDLKLFADWHGAGEAARVRRALAQAGIADWRHLDRFAELPDDAVLQAEAGRQARLRGLPESLTLPESRLVAGLIRDIVLPHAASAPGMVSLPGCPEKLEVGSCPTAEKCFLELAHGFITRQGRANRLVDGDRPLLIEKMHMGDNHSCVSIEPLLLNGVPVPAGSLFAVHYDPERVEATPVEAGLPGDRIPIAACQGFRLLRLTTLALAPEDRARAFTAHFEAQRHEGLFEPGRTCLAQLREQAAERGA